MAMMSTGNLDEDDTKVLQGIGIPVSKLMAYLEVIKSSIGPERFNECNAALQKACEVAGIDPDFVPQFGLVLESTLCLHGFDLSSWATVWSNVIKSMKASKKIPKFSSLLDKDIADSLEPSDTTEKEQTAKDDAVEVKEEAACATS